MKLQLNGRVVGHSLFQPNPKDMPELELARVSLVLASGSSDSTKHTKAVLIVDKDAVHGDFVLGRSVTITVQEYQGDLLLPKPSRDSRVTATASFVDPDTGEVHEGDPEKVAEKFVTRALGRSRASEPKH